VSAPGLTDVLRQRTFRLLFIGVTTSRIGDAMTFVVLTWLALNLGGPRAVGLVVFIGGCVTPISAPLIGHLLDRLGLRLLMLVDNLTRGLLMVVLAGLVHSGHVRLAHIVVFSVLSALLSPATELGQDVAVPAMLKSREFDAANRLLAASWDISAWIGPAIAGFGIEVIGSALVLLLDASTFFVMAFVALRMPGRAATRADDEPEQHGSLRRLLSGFVLLWRLRPVAVMTLVGVANLFLGGMMEVFLPAYNKLTLHQGAAAYGLLISAAGAMCLLGTLALTPLAVRLGYGPGLIVVLVARGLAVLPLAFVGSWGLAVLFIAIAAVPDGCFFPMSRTVQQRLIPPGVRGRVQGAKGALNVLGFPLGGAVSGLLLATWGPPTTAIVMGLGYLPLALAIVLTPQIMRHVAPADPDPPEADGRPELIASAPAPESAD
jgi:MFS family permease